jgi:hypothetical protein
VRRSTAGCKDRRLQLGNLADPDAQAERRNPPQVAAQAGHGVLVVGGEVETAFDEEAAGADRFGVFGDERPLLRGGRGREKQDCQQNERRAWCHVCRKDQLGNFSCFRDSMPVFLR